MSPTSEFLISYLVVYNPMSESDSEELDSVEICIDCGTEYPPFTRNCLKCGKSLIHERASRVY
jgi:ribosomal protein L40E